MVDPISSMLNQFGTTGFLTGGAFSTIWTWLKIILGTLFLAGGFGLFYKNMGRYNVYVKIKEREGESGTISINDKAMHMTDEHGKRKLVLQKLKFGKTKLSCPKPEAKYRQTIKTFFGKKDYYELWLDDSGALSPILPPHDDKEFGKKLIFIPEDRKAWQHMETKLNQEKYKKMSFLEKHQQIIVIGTTLLVVFLIVFFAFQHMSDMVTEVSQSVAQLASAVTSLGG